MSDNNYYDPNHRRRMDQDVTRLEDESNTVLHKLAALRKESDLLLKELTSEARRRFMNEAEFHLRVKTAKNVFDRQGKDVDLFALATAIHVAMQPIRSAD